MSHEFIHIVTRHKSVWAVFEVEIGVFRYVETECEIVDLSLLFAYIFRLLLPPESPLVRNFSVTFPMQNMFCKSASSEVSMSVLQISKSLIGNVSQRSKEISLLNSELPE